jgi:hypothetical protein
MSLLCSSCARLKNVMCTSAKKCLLSPSVFKPRLRLGQETQTRTKKMHFLALIHFTSYDLFTFKILFHQFLFYFFLEHQTFF